MRQAIIIFIYAVLSVTFFACSTADQVEIISAEERFRLGMEEYADENYFEAIQHFEIIRLQYPGSAIADSARYFTGMSRFNREEYLLASYEFNQMIQSHPSSRLLAEAQFMFAECYYKQSPKPALDQSYTVRAIDAFQTFIEIYPTHPKVSDAEKRMYELVDKLAEKEFKTGILYKRMENTEAALIYFNTVIDKYYNTSYADDALAEKIRILMMRKQYSVASSNIETFLKKYPDSPYKKEIEGLKKELASTLMPQ